MATSKMHRWHLPLLLLPALLFLAVYHVTPAAGDVTTAQQVTTHENTTDDPDEEHGGAEPHGGHGSGVHVASWNFDYVELPLVITAFGLFVGVAKIGFHHADFLSAIFPESVLLIILGVIFGGIAFATGTTGSLKSQTFFLYLLPPIILESAYSLHDRTFLDNLASILTFAVMGTLINTFLIGLTLYGISFTGAYGDTFTITFIECLIFSSLISAVDPVAVLAIFQEIHVNHVLYFLVFGESLLNDAVTVVLYNMMNSFLTLETIPASQIALGFLSFFTVSLGGAFIGLIIGLLTAFLTKYTEHVRVVEPLALLGMAYLSYLVAELFHFSGIISIICCGLAQVQYAFANISRKSSTTVTYFTKMLSTTTESLIFLQLGQTLWAERHDWNTGFILFTLIFIFVYRAFGVVLITFILNKFRICKINKEEQFIMSYGGLRGAVAFSLVATLSTDNVPVRNVLVTTTLVVIIVTVFLQGITIKPLVKLFRIKRSAKEESSVGIAIHQTVLDYTMAGVEEIVGHWGRNSTRMWLEHLDNTFMKRFLQREPTSWEDDVMKTFEKITNHDHHNHIFKVCRGEESRKSSFNDVKQLLPQASAAGDSYFEAVKRRRPFKKTQGGDYTAISDKTTPADIAGILRKNPSDALHKRYDKNLLKDDCHDLPLLMTQRSQEHSLTRERISNMTALGKWKHAFNEIKRVSTRNRMIQEEGRIEIEAAEDSGRKRDADDEEGGIVIRGIEEDGGIEIEAAGNSRKNGDADDERGIVIQGMEEKENEKVVKVDLELNGQDTESKL